MSSARNMIVINDEAHHAWRVPTESKVAGVAKAEIDEELIEAYRGTISLPFEPGNHKRVAVKIIDDRGIESLKIVEVG